MLYNLNTHAVLIEWDMDCVGSHKTISIGENTFSLFENIKRYIISDLRLLIDQHCEAINLSDLDAYYADFVDENEPMPEEYSAFHIEKLCSTLLDKHSSYLAQNPTAPSIKGEWSRLIEDLNYDLEGDYLYISIEGKIPIFAKEMINWLKSYREENNVLNFKEGRWINYLQAITKFEQWWLNSNTKYLTKFIDEFNRMHEFS